VRTPSLRSLRFLFSWGHGKNINVHNNSVKELVGAIFHQLVCD